MSLEIWTMEYSETIRNRRNEPIDFEYFEGKCIFVGYSAFQPQIGDKIVARDDMPSEVIRDRIFFANTNTLKVFVDPDRKNKYGDCLKRSQNMEFEIEDEYYRYDTGRLIAVKSGDVIPKYSEVINNTNKELIELLSDREVVERGGRYFLKSVI